MSGLNNELDDSVFLFGARQTGKSTFLRQNFPDSIYIDLLDTALKNRFQRRPSLLYEMLSDKEEGTLVIIDEIPEVPELLNEVHRLMSEKGLVLFNLQQAINYGMSISLISLRSFGRKVYNKQ